MNKKNVSEESRVLAVRDETLVQSGHELANHTPAGKIINFVFHRLATFFHLLVICSSCLMFYLIYDAATLRRFRI